MNTKLFVAMKAFVICDGKVLLLRESSSYSDGTNVGKYAIPGGRINPGEYFQDALLREVYEETGLKVVIGRPFFVNEWRPVIKGEQWQVVGTFIECLASSQDVVVLDADHQEFVRIDPKEYSKYPIIEDLAPVFEAYLKIY